MTHIDTFNRHIATPIALFLFFWGNIGICKGTTDLETIKERILTEVMKPSGSDDQIEKLINTFREDGTWPEIDYSDVSREGFLHRIHSNNMLLLARAYKTRSSRFYRIEKVKKVIEGAWENWVKKD